MCSVLTQDGPEVEYLVVDPGSTDDSPQILREFQQRYPGRLILIQEPDKGPADGLNKAFARATGDLFGYLNADDLYLPGCFAAAVRAANWHSGAAAIFADGYKADAEGVVTRHVVSTGFGARRFVYGGSLTLQQSTFYRREAFRAVGGFNLENTTSWDAEILLDMTLRGMQLVHVPGYWSVFRIHAESITGSQRLAEESRSTHERYFKKVMGRSRMPLDRVLAKGVRALNLLREPRATMLRLTDLFRKPRIDISELFRVQ